MIKAGGVELHKFHIGYPAAAAPGHGDAITGGTGGIAGVEIDPAGPSRGQHHTAGGYSPYLTAALIQHIGSQDSVAGQAQLAGGDQIHGHGMFQQLQIANLAGPLLQAGLNGLSGGVGGVDHPAMAMAALPG